MKKFYPVLSQKERGKKIFSTFLVILLTITATVVIAQNDEEDESPPTVSVFNIDSGNPTDAHLINIEYPKATISWIVRDEGGSHLSHVEVWRTVDKEGLPDGGQWKQIGENHSAPAGADSWSCLDTKDCPTDFPLGDGLYWYGIHVLDKAGNMGTEPASIQVTVDKTPPTGTIDANPKEVRANEVFNITVSSEDNTDMGAVCYKEENDIDWACYTCEGASYTHTFERTESALGKYRYYGYVLDAAENGSFTDPEYVTVLIETDPLVGTISVTNLQPTQATLNGHLTNMGGALFVEVWFEWGTTTAYGNKTGPVSKNTTGLFSVTITGLSPKTVYHFRAVAKNGVGTAFGEDMVTTELIKNGSFETGDLTSWTTSKWGYYKADTEDVYKGLYSGLFGFKKGDNKPNRESGLYQEVFIPSAATNVDLSLAYKFYTTDKCNYDFINIYLKDALNKVLKTYLQWCCQGCSGLNTYGWNEITDDLTGFAGKTVRIYFEVENRSDSRHRSWAYIDNVSIKYTPLTPPSVATKPATGIQTAEAVLNGELTDMGQASLVEVWFKWGFTIDYGKETEHISETSAGPFSTLIGNLASGTTYHFRAVAKSGAGTVYGDDLKFTTEYSAAGGWISPAGHEDPEGKWRDEPKAYDAPHAANYIETYASNTRSAGCSPVGPGYGGFIVFTLPQAVRSNKIRVNADYLNIHIRRVDIDVFKDGNWIDVHEGPVANCAWQEIPFSEGLVTKARFRYDYKVSNWCYWVYEFQFYKVPDEPITPPAGNTTEATSIEENSAILHGQVIDDGRELCQIRFQYGKTIVYDRTTEWEGSWASGETFGKFISGLEEGITYHFRAQIKNSAGIVSGADKTFFTQSALSGWVSPQGFSDPNGKWENEGHAFDDEIETYAKSYRYPGDGVWSPYLYLTRKQIYSDKIRFWARELVEVDQIVIDVFKDGSWTNVYSGAFPDYQWKEVSFAGGRVSQARVKFHSRYSNHYFYYHLYDFDFWKIKQTPTLQMTPIVVNVGLDYAKVKGELTDLGGAHSVDTWFVWDTGYHDNWQDYSSSSVDNKETMTHTGEFEYTITGLSTATTYHLRAVASSAAGASSSNDVEFRTLGDCTTGATTTCTSDEGCGHTIECRVDGTWPSCPRDECVKNTINSPDCPCSSPPPDYGNCSNVCTCEIGTGLGEPCELPVLNQPPQAAISCNPSNCTVYAGEILTLINLSTDLDSTNCPNPCNDDISKSEWDILNWGSDPDLSCSGLCNFTPQTNILGSGNYTIELYVKDKAGASNTTTKGFAIKKDATAGFMCSLDSASWQSCEMLSPSLGEIVYFLDNPWQPEHSEASEEATIVRRTWKLNDNAFSSDNNTNPSVAVVEDQNIVELTIQDSAGREATAVHNISGGFLLPEWREIAPF